MILIGITGIIGSGKTTVSSMLKKEGFEVIDLDGIAKEVLSLEDVKKDGPLLFETGLYRKLDKTVVVSTDAEMLGGRLKNRGMDEEDVKRRMTFQISLKEKEKMADWVVYNNGTVEDLKKETETLLEKIKGWEVEPHAS